jgi:hypothetical protein
MAFTLRRKVLVGILALDGVFSIMPASLGIGPLVAWLILNLLVIIPALVLYRKFLWKTNGLGKNRIGYHTKFRQESKLDQHYGFLQTTLNGETVRSFGEKVLADYFFKNRIRYQYEQPALSKRGTRISRPDFYLPDFNVYVEYWGMVDTDEPATRNAYVESMHWKMDKYHENGIRFISIYRENLGELDRNFKAKLRDVTGIDLGRN